MESGRVAKVYNVGSGGSYSVLEMMEQISKAVGFDLNPKIVARRSGDTPRLIASTTKIESELGWRPKSNLKEMIDSAWVAERKYGNGN